MAFPVSYFGEQEGGAMSADEAQAMSAEEAQAWATREARRAYKESQASGANTAASLGQQSSLGQTQLGMMRAGNSGALAQRAGLYAGGQVAGGQVSAASGERAGEVSRARQGLIGSWVSQSEREPEEAERIAAAAAAAADAQQQRDELGEAQAAADRDTAIKTVATVAATIASFLSDERTKMAPMRSPHGNGGQSPPAHGTDEDRTIAGLRGYEYQYRPDARARLGAEMAPEGDRYGIMAQDLEATPLGRRMVTELPDGTKAVDQKAATTGSLALIGRLGERIDALEGKRRAKWKDEA